MESEAGVNVDSHSWSSETNWTVVHGSLVNSVTFESSFSVINGDDDLKSTAKRCPLILKPTAPDSTPCEITISFAQKHELRQIYVKSTACVYEIYRRSNQQSENEYVWTVRCSAAAADQIDDHEAQSAYPNGPQENQSRENPGAESNRNGSSEEEWVKVKVPDSSSPSIKQEYYEATAQISDVDPCESVTIRFLSVRSKDSVFIDEVYVFADPFESTEPENSNGNYSNGTNSLMAMLLPSLSLMSKSKNSTGKIEEKKTNFVEIPSEPSRSNEDRESPANDRIGRSLDQLLSRIGRIEDMFSRLEENLLKPINGIEARLGRVEKQLEELLTDKHKPNLSCENDYQRNSNLDSNSNLNSVPSLVITAPEFSNCDDDDDGDDDDDADADDEEEENMGLGDIVAEISVDQPKRTLTVNDALAAALAMLMIGSEKDQTTPPVLSIRAPEFNEDIESGDEKGSSPRGHQDLEIPEETESQKGLASICIEFNSVEDCSKDGSEEDMKNVLNEVKSQHDLERLEETESEKGSLPLSLNTNSIEDYSKDGSEEETKTASNEVKSQCDLEKPVETNSQKGCLVSIIEVTGVEDHSKDGSEEESTIALNEVKISQQDLEKPEETETRNSLHEILGSFFSIPSSAVDFESPVLDVKFLSSGESDFSLEVLLSGEEETCSAEKSQHAGQRKNECCELISVEEGGDELAAVGPVIDSEIFVDVNYCNVQEDEIQLPFATFPTNLI